MLFSKRYQVTPTGGGSRPSSTGGAHGTSTTTTTTSATATGGSPDPAAARRSTEEAGRRLVGMTGGSGTVTAGSPQGRELTATRNSFHQHTDEASRLIRETRDLIGSRDLSELNPQELRTVRSNLDRAATHLSEARGIMRDVRAAYPNQPSLWVRSGRSQTEMWNFSGATANLDVSERGLRNAALIIDSSPFTYSDGLVARAHTPAEPGAGTTSAVAGPRRR